MDAIVILGYIAPALATALIGYFIGVIRTVRKVSKAEHTAIKALLVSQILDDYDKYVKHGEEHTMTAARHANICTLAESYSTLDPKDETYKKYTDALISQTPELVD